MKNLLACLAILAAFTAGAQTETSNFPYNPDVDQDGIIGVADILQLLSTFGQAFQVQVTLDLDSTSAVYFPPDWASRKLYHTQCTSRCDSLPGPWRVMSYSGFAKHNQTIRLKLQEANLQDLDGNTSSCDPDYSAGFWQNDWGPTTPFVTSGSSARIPIQIVYHTPSSPYGATYCAENRNYTVQEYSSSGQYCICELRQRPRVEYDFCEGNMTQVQSCAAGKVSEGWYPLELTSAGSNFVQTFWRWED